MSAQSNLTIAFLLATPGTTWGGMERHTADLADALAGRGHTVHILGHRAYRNRFSPKVHYHEVPVNLGRRNPWLALKIRRALQRISPDIIHAQGNKAAQLISRLRRFEGVTVGTVHGIKSSHQAFRRLQQVIAVSPQIFDSLDHQHKRLIYNGVDVKSHTHVDEKTPTLPAGVSNVIAVGRLEPVKGFASLIKAWGGLGALLDQYHLTIFGEGSQHGSLQGLIDLLDLRERVTLAGYCSNLTAAYSEAVATVISSEREGFPYVLIEALLYGCPVLSTPVAGAIDILPPGSLSTDHDETAIRTLIAYALTNINELRKTQEPAMAFARNSLTLEVMTTQTEQLYRNAINSEF